MCVHVRSGSCVHDLQELEEAFRKEQSLATLVPRALADLAYTVAVLALRGATETSLYVAGVSLYHRKCHDIRDRNQPGQH